MANLQMSFGIGGFVLIGMTTLMAFTNPEPKAYEEYAAEKLNDYLKENVCTEVTAKLGKFFQNHCGNLVDTARPQLGEIIARQTLRQNYFLFSIYETELSTPTSLPDYHFETVGILQNFFIYQADET